MIKQIVQFITGMEWGDHPDEYLVEDYITDCMVIVFAFLIFIRWWPL